jgi:hypothetical protein
LRTAVWTGDARDTRPNSDMQDLEGSARFLTPHDMVPSAGKEE